MNPKTKVLVLLPLFALATTALAQQVDMDREASEGLTIDSIDDGPAAEDRLLREFERYRNLLDEGAIDEADASAKRIVAMAIRIFGPESLQTAKALNNLAIVQSRSGQNDAAIQNFESAIEIIEDVEDRLNAQLLNPLKGLGSAQLNSGRPALAVRTFDRARHITHVNDGPHNIEQVEILESLAESTLRAGDAEGARDVLDRIHVLNVRHFENNVLGLLPSLMRRGDWQHRAGYYNDERATYRRVIRIIEKRLGKDHPSLLPPLQKLGESFYFVDLTDSSPYKAGVAPTGEIYFKRAVRVAESAPDLHWSERVSAELALADYYTYAESYNRARSIYAEMWELLSADEERLRTRARLLEQPYLLVQKPLPSYISSGAAKNARKENLITGTIRVDYTVSPRGRVRNLRTEAKPPEFTDMQRMVHREMRRRVFRPMMANAEPKITGNQVFEHSFYYRQSDLDKLRKNAPQPAGEPLPVEAEQPAETADTAS